MGKKKKRQKSSRKTPLELVALRDRKKRKATQARQSLLILLKIFLLVGGLGAVVIILLSLEQYVDQQKDLAEKRPIIELVNPPSWVNEQLKYKIYSAASADGNRLKLDEETVVSAQRSIEALVPWLDNVQVQLTSESLRVMGTWRKPLAMIQARDGRFYVDKDLVVLDYVPISDLPIVEITGSIVKYVPRIGSKCELSDIEAAIVLIKWLDEMDSLVSPDRPLLFEIASIDVSNFSGRVDTSGPHIVLYAKDGTQIIWGAEVGKWQRYLEATDKDKIASLYAYYRQHGTLMGGAKYINLRYPRGSIVQPADEY